MLTQTELAGLLGITRQYLSYLKNGQKNASPGLAEKLAKRTGTDRTLWIWGKAADRIKAIDKILKARA